MSTTNDTMRETTVRPSQQSLEDILQGVQGVEARLGKTVETVKGINGTVRGINTKLDKTIENVKGINANVCKTREVVKGIGVNVCKTREVVKEIDAKFEESSKQLREFRQSFGAKLGNPLEQVEGLDKKLDELPNIIAIFITARNTTFERAKL